MFKKIFKRLFGGKSILEPEEIIEQRRVYHVDKDYPCRKDPLSQFPVLNQLQSCFLDSYDSNRNCVIDAGTGVGKTVLAWIASRPFLDMGKKVAMIAPTRALVKDLYNSAIGEHGRKLVGLYTGADKDVEGKYFIVSTPEGYISSIRTGREWVNDVALLVVDEAHNLFDASRGGDIDVAITLAAEYGIKMLLMSGTFIGRDRVAKHFDADVFIADYAATKLNITEIMSIDDVEAVQKKGVYTFNPVSARVKVLEDLLFKHKDESVIVFAPTKAIGFALSEAMKIPFHCAEVDREDLKKIESGFNSGAIKTLLATNTLSQGVNTPCDVVLVFGTRRGGYYLDYTEVRQCFGRAGRGRPEADVYIIGDRIELFNSKKMVITKGLPLPVESMTLTMLSLKPCTGVDIYKALSKSFAATLATKEKVEDSLERCLHALDSYKILNNSASDYSLTKKGTLLARYYISPLNFIKYIRAAVKLEELKLHQCGPDISDLDEGEEFMFGGGASPATPLMPSVKNKTYNEFLEKTFNVKGVELEKLNLSIDKGCILLACLMPGAGECPKSVERDFQMRIIPLSIEKQDADPRRAGFFKQCLLHPLSMPPFLSFQLRDVDRLFWCFRDMEKWKVYDSVPGKEWLNSAVIALRAAAVKAPPKKKTAVILPLFKAQEEQKKAA